jgi:branched-chain amino acid transport system ATP-binding protein
LALSLAIEGLDAGYGAVKALRGVTLHVEAGENRRLARHQRQRQEHADEVHHGPGPPGRGRLSLTIDGQVHDLTKLSPEAIVDLGVALVPEGRRLFPKLTVTENLMLGAFRKVARSAIQQISRWRSRPFPA